MNVLPDLISAFKSLFESCGKAIELKTRITIHDKNHKKFVDAQWKTLLFSKDYNSISILKLFEKNNDWIRIDDKLKELLHDAKFDGIYDYMSVEKYSGYDNKYPLFQTKSEHIVNEWEQEKEENYIRITPLLYSDFHKAFKKYKRKNML